MDKEFQNNSLENFNWDNPTDESSFFSEFMDKEDNENISESEDKNTKEKNNSKEEVESNDNDISEHFSDFMDSEENVNDEWSDNSQKEDEKSVVTNDLYDSLKNYGLFRNIELEDGEEVSDDRIIELLEEDYDLEVEKRISDWSNLTLDDEARAFIEFKKNGGNTQDFFDMLKNSNNVSGDISDTNFQKKVIIDQLRREEVWTDEEILDRIDELEDLGKLEAVATKYYSKFQERADRERKEFLERQEQQRLEDIKSKKAYQQQIREALINTREIKGFRVLPKEKNDLYDFIINENKEFNGRRVTGLQKAIAEATKDPNKLILLSKLLKSDFDLSGFEKSVKSKEIKKLRETLESRKGLRPTNSSRNGFNSGKSLSELF